MSLALQTKQDGRFLKIRNAVAGDSGAYSCSYKGDGSLALPVAISVSRTRPLSRPSLEQGGTRREDAGVEAAVGEGECVDDPVKADCGLVAELRLCARGWYAKHCCATCSRA